MILTNAIVVLSSLVLTQAPQTSTEVDPTLMLRFGISAGSVKDNVATDATGRVRATVVGNPSPNDIGPGKGYRFNGAGDWLSISEDGSNIAGLLPSREITAEAWVNLASTTEFGSIIGCARDNGDDESGWMLGYSKDAFYFALAGKPAERAKARLTYLKGATPLVTGRWYHVVGTYDGRFMKLYVNGQLDAQSRDQSGDILYPDKGVCRIACYKDEDEQHPMDGTLVEVKVYNRALTLPQVVESYTPGVRLTSWQPQTEGQQRFIVDPYVQNTSLDAATIMWETAQPGGGWVEYGEALPYTGKTNLAAVSSGDTMHEVRISGLKPQTTYFYRTHTIAADGSEFVDPGSSFQTAVLPENPFAFAIIGDTQKNKPVIATLQAMAFSMRPNFEIHLGDVVDKGPDRNEWVDELLPASNVLMSRVPVFPAIGNHEENHSNFYRYFSLPDPENFYTYTYGNAQFFVVDTNKPVDPGSPQYQWLEAELAKSKATWKFAYHHHPVYSSDENDYGDTYKGKSTWGAPKHRHLAALYEKYHLDIAFAGHIHSYERTWPIRADKVDMENGVRYIVAGGGGGGLEAAAPNRAWFTQRVYRGHHLGMIMIQGKTLQLQVFDLEGRLFDHMDIQK